MANKEIVVTLSTSPTHVYFPGDTVTGNVHLNLSRDIDLQDGISITLYGLATVSWTEDTGSNRATFTDTETFFEVPQVHDATHEQSVYPFSFDIPSISTLPWSAVAPSGRIEYGVKALIKRPWFHYNKKGHATFTLKSPQTSCIVYSASDPYISIVRTSDSQETKVGCYCYPFCCWYYCCAWEKLRLSIAHDGSPWILPGDSLSFTVEVDNSSTSEHVGNGKVQLVGYWVHAASGEVKTSEKIFHQQILEINLPARQKKMISGALEIPVETMPTQVESKVLQLFYKLRVICTEMSGFRCMVLHQLHPRVDADVVIGVREVAAAPP